MGLDPESGVVGTDVSLTITSEGRDLYGDHRLYWGHWIADPDETNFELLRGESGRNVYEVSLHFTVPEVPYKSGSYPLTFYNTRLNVGGPAATFLFKVEPDIEINPPSASPGDGITISGRGLQASDDCQLSFDGKAVDIVISTDKKGSFTTDFTIPETAFGKHEFNVTSETLYNIDVTASVDVVPRISLEPEAPDVGANVTVHGYGFAASSEISIRYDDIVVNSSQATDEVGKFTAIFNVPDSSKDEHEIVATDGAGNDAVLSLALEGEAPVAPAAILPRGERFGLFGSQPVIFIWEEVSDFSGVTYTLEIARDLNFFPLMPGLRRSELTGTTCTVDLEPGTYYWRVRAVDGAGNEGEWTLSPYPFKVGLFSAWWLMAGGLVCLAILVFLVRAFFRRLKGYYY